MEFSELARAEQLLQQGRYDLAEREIRKHLAQNIEDPDAHAYLALCLINNKKIEEAKKEAFEALALYPDFPFAHFLLSKIYIEEDDYKRAQDSIKEALRVDPYEPQYYETLAMIYFNQGKYEAALEISEKGLQAEPEHVGCLNLRARCLVKLGRKEYANDSFTASFNKDPDNSYTHANQGWAFLEQKNYKGALTHFREALRLDPTNDFAKSGLVEALKAKYLIYKWFLQFIFWMESLGSQARWGLMIGLVIVNKIFPPLAPFYLVFLVFTWFSDVIFNSLLRLNKYGRHALNDNQRLNSNLFLGLILMASIALALGLFTGVEPFIMISLVCLGLLFPVIGTHRQGNKKSKKKSAIFMYCLIVVGVIFIGSEFLSLRISNLAGSAFLFGVVGYSWFANTLKH
jgi:tetratricopeptide (TPR) repeat protein